jgi:hypothetical protein
MILTTDSNEGSDTVLLRMTVHGGYSRAVAPLLAVCILGAAVAGQAAGNDLHLVRDGKALATIVQPRWEPPQAPAKEVGDDGKPTAASVARQADYKRATAMHAANVVQPVQVLQAYVKRISGATLPVVVDGSPEHAAVQGPQIHLGRTSFVADLIPGLERQDREHVVVKRVGDKVVIACGGDPRQNRSGMTFAMSTFLADVLGVRHYLPEPENAPDSLWTIVPQAKTIAVGDLDYAHTPAYRSRDFSLGVWASEKTAWMARNRIAWGGRFHIPHAIGNLLRPSKYAAEHPEFYPLLNGARFIPPAWAEKTNRLTKNWQPCFSNPGVVDALTAEAQAYLDAHPEAELVSMAHNDNYGWCECAECAKANGGVKYDVDGRINFSNLYFSTLNEICRRLEKSHPGKLVGAMVYQNGTQTPPDFKVHPNIVVMQTVDFSLFHARGPKHESLCNYIEEWGRRKIASRLAIHAWHVDFTEPVYPRLELESTKDFLAFHHAAGGVAYHGEEYPNFGLDGPKSWITAQLLWDPQQDVHALLQRFCDDCFGAAAAPMRGYFQALETAWNKNTASFNPYWCLAAPVDVVMTPAVIEECSRHLDDALEQAGTDVQRRRVAFFRDAFVLTRYGAVVAVAERTCADVARERELTPGMFQELLAKLNETAYGREALVRYVDRLSGDPRFLLNAASYKLKYAPAAMDPLFSRLASTLVARLARQAAAETSGRSAEEFTAAVRAGYAALTAASRAAVEQDVAAGGPAWRGFDATAGNFLAAVATVPRRQRPPTIDGTISADEWSGSPVLTGFREVGSRRTDGTGPLPEVGFQSEVRLGYDDQALYVAYRLTEENVANLTAVYDREDAAIWNDDSADFAILPPDTAGDAFCHYIANARAAVYDARAGAEWDGTATVKAGVEAPSNAYVVEVAIPWKDFGRKAESGQVWRAQFGRNDWRSGKCTPSSWAPASNGLNNSDTMGILLFE